MNNLPEAIFALAEAIDKLAERLDVPGRGPGRPPRSASAVVRSAIGTLGEIRGAAPAIVAPQAPLEINPEGLFKDAKPEDVIGLQADTAPELDREPIPFGMGENSTPLPPYVPSDEPVPVRAPPQVVTQKVTLEDLKTAFIRLMSVPAEQREARKEVGRKILGMVGVQRLTETPEARYKELMGHLLEAIQCYCHTP